MKVTARKNEALDALVWRATGHGSPAVERVLEANPGLAAIAAALPEHHPVFIPAIEPAEPELAIVQLWD